MSSCISHSVAAQITPIPPATTSSNARKPDIPESSPTRIGRAMAPRPWRPL
jgi:hypothetical protein